MKIREAGVDDAAQLAEVHVQSWKVAYRGLLDDAYLDALVAEDRLEAWAEWLAKDKPRGCVLAAEVDGRLVGLGSFVAHEELGDAWALVPQLYLHPDAIGTGVGRALMAAGLDRLRAEGFEHAELWVHEGNHRAQRFYEAGGWIPDGTRKVEQVWGVDLPDLRYTIDL